MYFSFRPRDIKKGRYKNMKRTLSVLLIAVLLLVSCTVPAFAETGTVTATERAYIRSGPGLSYSEVSSIDKGKSVPYAGQTSTDNRGVKWYKVRIKSGYGWVSSNCARLSGTGSAAPKTSPNTTSGSIGTVMMTGSANVRSGPGLGYSMLDSFSKGNSIPYVGQSSVDDRGVTWYKVKIKSGYGWVSSKYARLSGSSSAAPKSTAPSANGNSGSKPTGTFQGEQFRLVVQGSSYTIYEQDGSVLQDGTVRSGSNGKYVLGSYEQDYFVVTSTSPMKIRLYLDGVLVGPLTKTSD